MVGRGGTLPCQGANWLGLGVDNVVKVKVDAGERWLTW